MAEGKNLATVEPQLHSKECVEDSDAPASQPSLCKMKTSRRSQDRHASMDGIHADPGQQPWQVDQEATLAVQIKPLQHGVGQQPHTSSQQPQEQLLQPHVTVQQAPKPLQQTQQQQHPQQVRQQSAIQRGRQTVPPRLGCALAPAAPGDTEDEDALIETTAGRGPGLDSLLALHDLSSAMPFAPRSFISNEGATMGPSSQRRRLSVAIPGGVQGSGNSSANQVLQSPVGGMMASLMAEAAQSGMTALNTPWSAHNPNLVNLLSPTGAVLDVNPLASPRMPGVTAASTLECSADQAIHQVQLSRMLSAGLAAEPPAAAVLAAAAEAAMARSAASSVRQKRGSQQQAGSSLVGCKRPRAAPYDDGRCAEICHAAQAAAFAAMGSPGTNMSSDFAALAQWQHTIEAAEQHWGPSHPAVGRAWLELARALQAVDKDSERAKLATKKAFDICQILLKQTAMESRAQESFQYLLDKFNRKATAAKQAAQTAAVYAAQEAAEAAAAEASAAAAAAATVVPAMPLGFGHLEGNTAAAAAVPAVLQQQYQQPQLAYAAYPVVAQPGVTAAMVFPVSYPGAAMLQPHAGSIPPAALPQQQSCIRATDASSAQAAAAVAVPVAATSRS